MNSYLVSSNSSIAPAETLGSTLQELINIEVFEYVAQNFLASQYCPWVLSLLGSMCVGLCGIFPLLIIPIDDGIENLKVGDGAKKLRILLSFAVGGLLGDVFLHLLPEAWEIRKDAQSSQHPSISCGLWVLSGMLAFVILEKIFSNIQSDNDTSSNLRVEAQSDCHNDHQIKDLQVEADSANNNKPIEVHCISGYLNLAANSIDNFTHGLAIGTSFCISIKLGCFSTFAILVHELPHEVGDFAILLKSGFSRWEAARAQVMTATAGIAGAMVAVVFGATNASASWILPFTAGGFLHIALVSVLPELIREESRLESAKQLFSLASGIAVMALLIVFFD